MQLKNYVPFFISKIKEMDNIYEVQGKELDKINLDIQDLIAQCFVNTATWGLDYWENFLNITTDLSKDIEYRRSTIIAKLRGQGTTTKTMIQNVAESFSNGEVEVIENAKDYSFIIKFVGTKGIPPNMEDLKEAIEEIKPAHLDFSFEYLYNTWNMISGKTWGELETKTWEEIITI